MEPPSKVDREKTLLAQRVYGLMDSSFAPAPGALVPSFRLWHYPAAGHHLSWSVFQPRADDPLPAPPIVRRIAWDRDRDWERLELGGRRRPRVEPTLRITEHALDPEALSGFLTGAHECPLPRNLLARPYRSDRRREFGLDGFDLESGDGRPIVRIEWDAPPPKDLEPIAGWAAQARRWLSGACR